MLQFSFETQNIYTIYIYLIQEGEGEGVLAAPGVDTLHEETELQHPDEGDVRAGQGEEVDGQDDKGKPQLVRYTEIR